MSDLSQRRKEASILSEGSSDDIIKETALNLIQNLDTDAKRILDLGCGQGTLISKMRSIYPNAYFVGSDLTNFNPSSDYDFVELDLNNTFSQHTQKFDIITCLEVIEHLENPRMFIREIANCLEDKGYLILSTPNPESYTSIISFFFRGYHSAFGGKAYPAHITCVSLYDLQNCLLESQMMKLKNVQFINNGRIPGMDVKWHSILGFLRGKRFSDNYIIIAQKS